MADQETALLELAERMVSAAECAENRHRKYRDTSPYALVAPSQLREWADRCKSAEARVAALEAELQGIRTRSRVTDQPGHPVAAPCVVSHCQYAALEADRDALQMRLDETRACLGNLVRAYC